MHKTWKAVAGICMLFGTLFVAGSAAGAQECGGGGYFDPVCVEVLEYTYPATVTSGGSIYIEGSISEEAVRGNRASADTVEFEIADRVIGNANVADDGTFSGTFTVPSVAAGEYTIVGTSGDLVADGPITIVARGTNINNDNTNRSTNTTNTGTGALARTGFDATPMITLGAAALVLGGAAVYGSKRRRTA